MVGLLHCSWLGRIIGAVGFRRIDQLVYVQRGGMELDRDLVQSRCILLLLSLLSLSYPRQSLGHADTHPLSLFFPSFLS